MADSLLPDGKRAIVSITFDDARVSQLDVAVPILDAHGVKATFYVLPKNMTSQVERWRKVAESGHEIGSHTLIHPCSGNFGWARDKALEDFSLERMELELTGANAAIEEMIGVRPVTFAYPCGQSFVGRGAQHRSYVPLVAQHFLAGRAYGSESANTTDYCDLAFLAARGFDAKSWSLLKEWIEKAREDGSWLILGGHDAGASGFQTVGADTLEELCRYARESDVWVETVETVARHLRSRRPMAGDVSVS